MRAQQQQCTNRPGSPKWAPHAEPDRRVALLIGRHIERADRHGPIVDVLRLQLLEDQ